MSLPPRRIRRRVPSAEERRRVLEEAPAPRASAPPRPPVEVGALVVTAVVALLGLAVLAAGRRVEPLDSLPYRGGVAIGLVAAALYVAGLFRLLRPYGEPPSAALFVARIGVFALAVFGATAAATGTLALLNVRLDSAPADEHRMLVVDKQRVGTGNGTLTSVRTPAWWDAGVMLDFTLPESAFDRIQPRQSYLLVRTRPGAFGWTYVDGEPEVTEEARTAAVAAPEAPAPVETVTPSTAPAAPEADRREAREIYQRAMRTLRAGGRDAAVADLRRAIELDPAFVFGYRGLEEALTPVRDWPVIIEHWSKLIELQPKNAYAWDSRARVRALANEIEGAVADAEEACRLGRAPACDTADRLRARGGS
jgi:hypothetical protein